MKKTITAIIVLCIITTGGLFTSFSIAKKQAQKVAQSFVGNLSPLSGDLVLFGGPPEINPSWVFRAEYVDLYTGATFDVYVSLLGKIIRIPPYSKAPK